MCFAGVPVLAVAGTGDRVSPRRKARQATQELQDTVAFSEAIAMAPTAAAPLTLPSLSPLSAGLSAACGVDAADTISDRLRGQGYTASWAGDYLRVTAPLTPLEQKELLLASMQPAALGGTAPAGGGYCGLTLKPRKHKTVSTCSALSCAHSAHACIPAHAACTQGMPYAWVSGLVQHSCLQ